MGRRDADRISVGKKKGHHSFTQAEINGLLVRLAREGKRVARLKGGDPMVFGRAQEEIDALDEAGIEYEVVPGITAALAASASLGVSLTRRGIARTLAFLTPRVGRDEEASEWVPAAMGADSIALYMAAGASQQIAQRLIAAGKPAPTPAVLVESVSLPGESRKFTTLAELAAASRPKAAGPVVMLVGEVFRDREVAASLPIPQTAIAS